MPQPKSQPRRKTTGASRSASAKKGAARRSTARKSSSRSSASGAKRASSGAASKRASSGAASTRASTARATSTAGSPEDVVRANLKAFRDALASSVQQLNLVMVSRDRIQDALDDATTDARRRATGARRGARRQPGVDRVLREVDRGRRAAGIPPSFPVLGYDDLSAAQVNDRLDELTPAELRKVRDYERRNANRKSVLSAIEKALA